MMSAKLGLYVFVKQSYSEIKVMTSKILIMTPLTKFYHVDYIIDVVIWPKIGEYNILKRKVIIIRSTLLRKINFLEGCFWFRFNNLGLALGMTLKIPGCTTKGLRLKVSKFWRPIPTFAEYTWGKTGKGPFSTIPS